ncbi:MAG: CapA family protein [bacterium]|nr:CapA family protein [bacterium]
MKAILPRLVIAVFLISIITSCSTAPEQVSDGETTILVTGDALITLPLSNHNEPEFLQLIEEIRDVDVAITNLEMLIHTYKGYPQANSGGTYMAAPPEILDELKWAGFDMMSHANNHTYDYGEIAILETHEYAEKSGIPIAGSGKDLQRARQPVYFESADGKTALLSTSSTFTSYGKASPSRPDIHGRPGLNPLTVERKYRIDPNTAANLIKAAQEGGIPVRDSRNNTMRLLGANIAIGDEYGSFYEVDENDLEGNLEAVREAENNADHVVISMHSHEGTRMDAPPEFLSDFAHKCIDNGADVFFVQGPHILKGIEIYKGKPIFYSLGNFVFQNETVEKQPWEFYDRYGLDDNATPQEAYTKRTNNDQTGFPSRSTYWEAIVPVVKFKDGDLVDIKLIPITLLYGEPRGVRGRPLIADTELSQKILNSMIEMSEQFGTKIEIEGNTGYIRGN